MQHGSMAELILLISLPIFFFSGCSLHSNTNGNPQLAKDTQLKTPPANTPRNKLSAKVKWQLSDLFANKSAWQKEYQQLTKEIKKISNCQGKLSRGAITLYNCLEEMHNLQRRLELVYGYAMMKMHVDQEVNSSQEIYKKSQLLYVDFAKRLAFVNPEIMAIKDSKLRAFLKNKKLKKYDFYLKSLLRMRRHIRSKDVEEALARAGNLMQAPTGIFDSAMLDIKFPKIKDEKNKAIELTLANYPYYRGSAKRSVRKEAVQKFFATLLKYKNILASTYTAAVNRDIFQAQTHNYKSSLAAALYPDNIDPQVYQKLVSIISKNLPQTLHRYVKLRKEILKLENIHFYDLYNPLLPNFEKNIFYPAGVKLITDALKPLGADYSKVVSRAMQPGSGWIDIYPNKGKRSGAYSNGLYGVHPFILHNYLDNLDSVFTTAHEFGHAMHSYYSSKTQDYIYADYPIFLAEIASTVNEELLLEKLLKEASNRKEKLYLLNRRLENIRQTIFRQTMFAEFEEIVHQQMESGQPITADSLNAIYAELVKKYYGPDYKFSQADAIEWAYIPHFYRSFYVYQYATGLTSAIAISEKIRKEGKVAVKRYLKLLNAGGSDYPLNILKRAGVDLTDDQPYLKMISLFKKTLKEFETVYRQK